MPDVDYMELGARRATFLFEVDGVAIGEFLEVSGLKLEVEVTTVEEGGENGFVHKLPGRMTWPNLVFKRGMTSSDALFEWVSKSSGDGFAGDDRGGAAGDHVVQEGMAVGPQARQGEEERARDHAAAVRHDRGHAHRSVARPAEHGQPLEQRVEGGALHRGGHHRGRRRHRPRSATGPRGRVETGGRSSQRMHFSATSRKIGAETLPP